MAEDPSQKAPVFAPLPLPQAGPQLPKPAPEQLLQQFQQAWTNQTQQLLSQGQEVPDLQQFLKQPPPIPGQPQQLLQQGQQLLSQPQQLQQQAQQALNQPQQILQQAQQSMSQSPAMQALGAMLGGGGGGPSQVVPGLEAGDLMGLATMLMQMNGGGDAFSQVVSLFPGGELLAQAANTLQGGMFGGLAGNFGAAAQGNPLLGPMGGDVLGGIIGQAEPFKQGIQTPPATMENLMAMFQGFGLTGGPSESGLSQTLAGQIAGLFGGFTGSVAGSLAQISQAAPLIDAMNQINPLNQFQNVANTVNQLNPLNQFQSVTNPINQFQNVTSAVNQLNPINQIQSAAGSLGALSPFGQSGQGGGSGALAPPQLAQMAASAMQQAVTSPFLMPAVSEMKLLQQSFQNVMSAAQAPAAAAKQNPLQQLLSVNQQLTGQFLAANQLFVQGSPLLGKEPPPPPSSSLLNLYSQLIENARPPDTFGNPVSEIQSGAKVAASSAVSSVQGAIMGTPLAGAIQAVAQTNQLFVSAQSQITGLLGNALFSQQLGLPVHGATPAVTPGVLPFNLVNAMLGLLSTPLPMQAQGQGPSLSPTPGGLLGAGIELANTQAKALAQTPSQMLKTLDSASAQAKGVPPQLSVMPGLPNVPKVPNIPGIPNVPKVPNIPGLPNVPGIPNVPNSSSAPKIPNTPGTASARALDQLRAAPKEPR